MEEMLVVVDNRVRVQLRGMVDLELAKLLQEPFEHKNPKNAAMKAMRIRKIPSWVIDKTEPPVIRTWRTEEGGWMSFPRGGLRRVLDVLKLEGIDHRVEDRRVEGTGPKKRIAYGVELWAHQELAVSASLTKEQGIVRAGTGGGKTEAVLAMVARCQLPSLVIVPSAALQRQWVERAARTFGVRARDIGVVGGGKRELRQLTVGIQKTVANLAAEDCKFREYFGAVFADELQFFAASSFIAAMDPFPARYRIGVSADETRKDRKEFLIHDLFGDVVMDIGREGLVDAGHIMDVEIRVVPTSFEAPWYGMPDEANPEMTVDFIRLCKEMAQDDVRNAAALDIARGEVSRGEQVILMVHERSHVAQLGPALADLGCGELMGGPESVAAFEATVNGMRRGDVRVGVGTYKAAGTGIDIPRVGVGIAVTPISANRQFFNQVRGRFCRTAKGKTLARLYVLWDSSVFPAHLKNLVSWNPTTVVQHRGEWVPAKQYIREWM